MGSGGVKEYVLLAKSKADLKNIHYLKEPFL